MKVPSFHFHRHLIVVIHAGHTNRLLPEGLAYEEEHRMMMDKPGWSSPVPLSATTDDGTTWQVCRAWSVGTPGDYVLEVRAPGASGVRGARLRSRRFKLIPPDDPKLPALLGEAGEGDIISYRPYRQAVIRADGHYIKVFRPGRALIPAERCGQMDVLLHAGTFITPRILLRRSEDVIVFSALPGRTLSELGSKEAAVSDEVFTSAWEKWSHAWVAQLGAVSGPRADTVLNSLPLRSADVVATELRERVNSWLRHNENVPESWAPGQDLLAAVEHVAGNLLGSSPDPLRWAHGDLHDKQILVSEGASPPGLLDFDSAARAEGAFDLADLDVHLELHLRQDHMMPARYLTAHAQVVAAAQELNVSPRRFLDYSDAFWIRLACSPLPGRMSLALAVLAGRAKDYPRLSGVPPQGTPDVQSLLPDIPVRHAFSSSRGRSPPVPAKPAGA